MGAPRRLGGALLVGMLIAGGCADVQQPAAVSDSTTAPPTTATTSSTTGSTSTTTSVTTTSTTSTTTSTVPTTTAPSPPPSSIYPTTSPPTTVATAPLAGPDDLVGSLSLSVPAVVPGQEFGVSLTVTNVADHRIALEDRVHLDYVAARLTVVGADPLTSGYWWLGDRELEPGESHTMSRTWELTFSASDGDEIEVVAVIAGSLDSFNRAQATIATLDGVPTLVVPVGSASA